MMGGPAGLHADQAKGTLAKEVSDLLAPQLTSDDDLARTIHAVHLEHVREEINADGAKLRWTTSFDDSLFKISLWHIRCRERASSTTSFARLLCCISPLFSRSPRPRLH